MTWTSRDPRRPRMVTLGDALTVRIPPETAGAVVHHRSIGAAFTYWDACGSRSGHWDREDYAYDAAIRVALRADREVASKIEARMLSLAPEPLG